MHIYHKDIKKDLVFLFGIPNNEIKTSGRTVIYYDKYNIFMVGMFKGIGHCCISTDYSAIFLLCTSGCIKVITGLSRTPIKSVFACSDTNKNM